MSARTFLLLAGICAAPLAQALEVRPSIQVGAVYTDNLFLTPENEIDDIVTRVDPSIGISHKSQRIDFVADYTYTYLHYSESDDSDASFSQGSAALDLTLVRNAFYLESAIEQSQQVINPENSVWYTNVPIIDNRTDELRIETSPHLDTEILGVAVDARYVLGTVAYDSPDVQDVDYQEAHTAITGTERGKGLSWGLFHDYQVYEFETPPDNKSQLAYGTLTYGFRQAGDFFVFGSLGQESSYEDLSNASLEDTYWQVGFRHVTSRRLIEAAYGDRSFGSTISGRIRQELNRGSFEVMYREDPSVEEQLYEQRPKGATTQPPPQVPPGVERPGVGNRFVYKLASATLVKELGRNTVEAVLFYDKRDEILSRCEPTPECNATLPDDAVQDSEEQVGVSLGLSRQLGRRTTVGLEGEVADREFTNGNTDRISAIRLVGNYDLGRK
ncbi:MAG: TIGR03016 family PEP-CTERM system-associated outer membrane protein, partial [Gammaproteobacteria bacterium]|nr:TIGR03016 family PEP-CTERM system-associated outer membrane protein [Gammaproteobacteria bacterium]